MKTLLFLLLPIVLCVLEFPINRSPSLTTIGPDQIHYLKPDYLNTTDYMNNQYNTNITIGSTNQQFNVQLDTGSAWFWVTSADQEGDVFTSNRFNCAASSTCTSSSKFIAMQYGLGNVNGTVVYDTVSFGDSYTVPQQAFLLINSTSNLTGMIGDGVFGLGFATLSNGIPTFLDNLLALNLVQSRSFSLFLSNDPNNNDTNSVLLLDGYDLKYTSAPFLTFLPVIDTNYWGVGLSQVKLGNTQLQITSTEAIIDSGSSIFVLPQGDFNIMLAAFQQFDSSCQVASAQNLIQCQCLSPIIAANYPTIQIYLGTVGGNSSEFAIPASQYVSWYGGSCYLLVQSLDGIDNWILGDVFMSYYYSYFNQDTMQIALGLATGNSNPNTLFQVNNGSQGIMLGVWILIIVYLLF